jgi:UDP-N-acetylmuramoyl-tripeptide--D-alanyl-D-alanine ligase
MNFTVAELALACGGRLLQGNPNQPAGRIGTDTRTLQPGETFLGLSGRNFRGEDFIPQAVARGAAGLIASALTVPEGVPESTFYIQVPDTLRALGDIAMEWRRVVDPRLAVITGSAGKTTTKEMLAFLCRSQLRSHATEGNFNNLIGLPLTLLRLREEHEACICELGMNHPGELRRLTEIAIPDIAIITNIGNAHIGNFGTMERLIAAKAEPFEAMPRDSTAVINADCPHASMMGEAFNIPPTVITYGQNPKADIRAENVRLAKPYGYDFTLRILEFSQRIHLKVFGRYQVNNALAAAAGAVSFGIDASRIAECLAEFNAPAMRAQTEWFDGMFIVTDCYNASPDSVIATLWSLNDVQGLRRKAALLGDMKELGDQSRKYHERVGRTLAEAGFDIVCTVGTESEAIVTEAATHGLVARHFTDGDEAAAFLCQTLQPNDALVIKGSRAMRMEDVLLRLKERRAALREGSATPAGTETV